MASRNDEVLQRVKAVQNSHELSILKLSEPISTISAKTGEQRQSDSSADSVDNPSPASLEADLSHYKVGHRHFIVAGVDLFTNRNFSPNYDSPTSSKSRRRSSCAQSLATHH